MSYVQAKEVNPRGSEQRSAENIGRPDKAASPTFFNTQ